MAVVGATVGPPVRLDGPSDGDDDASASTTEMFAPPLLVRHALASYGQLAASVDPLIKLYADEL